MSKNSTTNNLFPIFQKAFQCYRTLTSIDVSEYEKGAAQLVFPVLPIPMLNKLCSAVAQIFSSEPNILELPPKEQNEETEASPIQDMIIVGDLHGHILDLFRILKTFGYPPKSSYLFLGDIVDRGDFSTETAVLILLMKVLWPKNIYLIRGNHEFADMWDKSGFSFELMTIYNINNNNVRINENKSIKAAECFARAFSYIPLAALLYGKYLCVHGGIGPEFTNFRVLNEIERPLNFYNFEPVDSILWSDPSDEVDTFLPSARGSGFVYGTTGLGTFLESQNLSLLIRGHQCIEAGVEFKLENRVATVFSASLYCGRKQNKAGVLIVDSKSNYEAVTFPALRYIQRCEASFLFSSNENSLVFNSRTIKLNLPSNVPLPPPTPPITAAASSSQIDSSKMKLAKSRSNSNPNLLLANNGLKSKQKSQNCNPNLSIQMSNNLQNGKSLPHLPNAKPISNADAPSQASSQAGQKHSPNIPTPSPRPKEKPGRYHLSSSSQKEYSQFNNLNTRNKLLAGESDLISAESLTNLNPNLTYNPNLFPRAIPSTGSLHNTYEPSNIFANTLEPPILEKRKGKSSQKQLLSQKQPGLKFTPNIKKASYSSSNFYDQPKTPSAIANAPVPRKKEVNRNLPKNIYRKSVPV